MDPRERLDDPDEALRAALGGHQATMWTALPGIVESYQPGAGGCGTVSVQPAIQGTVSGPDGVAQLVNLPLLVDVPVVGFGAGGFVITVPIKPGDEVLVVFASRCIDAWWTSGGVGAPTEMRMHDLSDGFALPCPMSQAKRVENINPNAIEMRNESGTGRISIDSAGNITIASPTVTLASATVLHNGVNIGSTHVHTGVEPGPSNTGGPI